MPRVIRVLVNLSSVYGRQLIDGVGRFARTRRDWQLVLDGVGFGLPDYVDQRDGSGCDGVIARVASPKLARRVTSWKETPVVNVGGGYLAGELPSVMPEGSDLPAAAVDHLLACGFGHLAFCGFDEQGYSRGREADFVKQAAKEGITPHVFRRTGRRKPSLRDELAQIAAWLADLPRPCGVFTCNDWRGQHVVTAAVAAGLRVPHDIGVLGVGDDELVCGVTPIPLSSVERDVTAVGFRAAEVLDRWLDTGRSPENQRVPVSCHVHQRQSTDVLVVDDELVGEALRRMKESDQLPTNVVDVLNQLPTSRRPFERRFREATGQTPHAVLTRFRVERAADLLTRTDLNVQQIAERCGLSMGHQLAAIFRKARGVGPAEFRKAALQQRLGR